ncbi:MAG: D-alanine--D-alanine ligase [Candidatus Cloacimonadia bacterium]
MKKKVILLQGGISEEREVSLETSEAVAKALKNLGNTCYPIDPIDFVTNGKVNYEAMLKKIKALNYDIVFNGLHGGEGENGIWQTLLEAFDIDFTGTTRMGSFISMHKKISKLLANSLGIPVPQIFLWLTSKDRDIEQYANCLSYPVVVKPNSSGSSVGVTIVQDPVRFIEAVDRAFQFDKEILVEEYIDGREITVPILGNRALPVVEIKPNQGWYDYAHKYTEGQSVYEVPAQLPQEEAKKVSDYAITIYEAFYCRDYARVDFRYNGKDFYFLELNTLPGMTRLSLVPMSAKASGINFDELINLIIEHSWR